MRSAVVTGTVTKVACGGLGGIAVAVGSTSTRTDPGGHFRVSVAARGELSVGTGDEDEPRVFHDSTGLAAAVAAAEGGRDVEGDTLGLTLTGAGTYAVSFTVDECPYVEDDDVP
jgi:hypothetical protein